MTQINGVRFGKRDRKNRIKVIIPGGSRLTINGAEVTLKTSAIAFVDSHEDANKVLSIPSPEVEIPEETTEVEND